MWILDINQTQQDLQNIKLDKLQVLDETWDIFEKEESELKCQEHRISWFQDQVNFKSLDSSKVKVVIIAVMGVVRVYL